MPKSRLKTNDMRQLKTANGCYFFGHVLVNVDRGSNRVQLIHTGTARMHEDSITNHAFAKLAHTCAMHKFKRRRRRISVHTQNSMFKFCIHACWCGSERCKASVDLTTIIERSLSSECESRIANILETTWNPRSSVENFDSSCLLTTHSQRASKRREPIYVSGFCGVDFDVGVYVPWKLSASRAVPSIAGSSASRLVPSSLLLGSLSTVWLALFLRRLDWLLSRRGPWRGALAPTQIRDLPFE